MAAAPDRSTISGSGQDANELGAQSDWMVQVPTMLPPQAVKEQLPFTPPEPVMPPMPPLPPLPVPVVLLPVPPPHPATKAPHTTAQEMKQAIKSFTTTPPG